MKILLRKDVQNLGNNGDVVNVKNGYARNYLLPKKFATTVTPGNIKQINLQKAKQEKKYRGELEELQVLADEISKTSCSITVKTNKEGKLFGSVTAHHIAVALSEKGHHVDENMIVLDTPIKKCDLYSVTVVLHPEIKTPCKVWVVSETDTSDHMDNEEQLPSQSKSEIKK